jgi:tetratricopeptide (TPR) repeat protein
MTELRIETLQIPAADLGPDNPLPPLRGGGDLHAVTHAPGVPDDMLQNMRYGHLPNILPYTLQDGYNRQREPRDFRVAVLENDLLKATFLLERGGRLWSLLHKPSGRELLARNPVFQPANLALRDAWFSGGVEWNTGTIGHWPLTCAPLFAAQVNGPDGIPILRLYEWERMRQVVFQLDIYLPPGSPLLYVRARITNPHPHDVPMYWWSNMAVPESAETRVIVPATTTYKFMYQGELKVLPVPMVDDADITYTTNSRRAMDYFFHIPDDQRRWITALDGQGKGLVQVSTDRLQGRKLFLWGMGTGGKNWQDFLSEPGHPYLEIQAGLARTQLEHLRMPAQTEWAWLEGYGLMEADPAAVRGADWSGARAAVESRLEELAPRGAFEAEFARGAAYADQPPAEIIQRGSGWGTLERLRREQAGEPPFCSPGLVFDEDSLGEAQAPWLRLLRAGVFPAPKAEAAPTSYLVQTEWRALLEDAQAANNHWFTHYHLGIMYDYHGDRDAARRAWERSLEQTPTAWAWRNLALVAADAGQLDRAAECYRQAHRLKPDLLPLTLEAGHLLLKAGHADEALEMIAELSNAQRLNGRIRLLEGRALLAAGDLEAVGDLLAEPFSVDNLREGEPSLSDLWFDFHERRLSAETGQPLDDALRARVRREHPLPPGFDFRMSGE